MFAILAGCSNADNGNNAGVGATASEDKSAGGKANGTSSVGSGGSSTGGTTTPSRSVH